MKRMLCVVLSFSLFVSATAPAFAAVNVERRGDENPMVEVARSVMWGALAGAVVGGAVALADKSPENGEPIRIGVVAGTFVGLAYGLWWSTHRPSGAAMIELRDGTLRANAIPALEFGITPAGVPEARVKVIGATF